MALSSRRILIGFADALAAPESAWSLLESGAKVVAFARRGSRPPLRRSRSVEIVEITAPERDAAAATDELSTLLAREGVFRAVMPLDDGALWLCERAAQRGIAVDVAGPTGPRARLALDKRLQFAAASAAGLAVPPTRCVEGAQQLLELRDLPLVLKPANPVMQRGGRLVRGANHVCGSEAELRAAADAWDGAQPLLAQPLIVGVGEGLFGLARPDGLLALSAHRRLRMANPQGSGSSACVSVPVDPELASGAERMLSEAGWSGMFMLEFLRAPDGIAWFMELNGRTWGSMALARGLGLEYPAWAVRLLDEPQFEPVAAAREGHVARHLGRELTHLMTVMRGPKSVALTHWPSRRRAARDVLRFARGERWYNLRAGEERVFVEDTIGTLLTQIPGRRRR